MANKEIDNLALLTAPVGADMYAVKTDTDYRVRVGEANGIATLETGAKLTSTQLPTHSHAFSTITSKPTTLSGYGITDAATGVHTHTFASLTSKPTTLAGFGITDGASSSHTHTFASLTSKPTTLAGFGITDAQPAGSYATSSHTHTFASLTSKPTTLAGYGITDGGGAAPAWGSVTGTLSNQTDLQSALNAKQAAGSYAAATHTHSTAQVTNLDVELASKASTTHNHTLDSLSNTTITSAATGEILARSGSSWINRTLAEAGIQPAGSYAASSHTHTTAQVTGLDTALAGKAATSHTHTMSQITDSGTWATKNQTVSTAAASGTPGAGDVWLQYTP